MTQDELMDKLKDLNIEDFIWVIYLGIIALSYISNHYERFYYLTNKEEYKKIYRNIIILIFAVLFIVYIYFFNDSLDDMKNINNNTTAKAKNLKYLSAIASGLIVISGAISLFIAIMDEDLDVELAFN